MRSPFRRSTKKRPCRDLAHSKGIVLPKSLGSTFPRRLTATGRLLRGSPFAPHFISAERVDIEGSPGGNPNGSRPSAADNPANVGRLQTRNSENAFGGCHSG